MLQRKESECTLRCDPNFDSIIVGEEFWSLLSEQPYLWWQTAMVTTERKSVVRYLKQSGYPTPEVALWGCRQGSQVWEIPIENSTKAKMIDWLWGLMEHINPSWCTPSVSVVEDPINFCSALPQMEEALRDPLKTGAIGVFYCTFIKTDKHAHTDML